MSILENYVKFYLLKESINIEDSKKIQQYIKTFESSLKSSGLDLDSLDFDYMTIARLRDARQSVMLKKEMIGNSVSYKSDREISALGLGFNLIHSLSDPSWKKKNGEHKTKIVKLINLLKKTNNGRPMTQERQKIQVLRSTLALKKAIDDAGLKLLGAGLFRAALQMPGVDEVVLKIALSDKGRKDSKKEIEFSKGTGASRLDHVKNFPTIYDHSKNGAWYAIEKVLMIDKSILNAKDPKHKKLSMEVTRDLKQQFPTTFKFLSDIHIALKKAGKNSMINVKSVNINDQDLLSLFTTYLSALFQKRTEFSTAHDSIISNAIKKTKLANAGFSSNDRKTKPAAASGNMSVQLPDFSDASTPSYGLSNLSTESYNRILKERNSPESVVSFKIIDKKLKIFLNYVIQKYMSDKKIEILKATIDVDTNDLTDTVVANSNKIPSQRKSSSLYSNNSLSDLLDFIHKESLSKDKINKMINEIGSMFDQAVVTNIVDLHIGNMGFKKNENDKWQLIFTDIDTGI